MTLKIKETNREAIMQSMVEAMKSGDVDNYMQSVTDLSGAIQDEILAQVRNENATTGDSTILASRGARQLTSKETNFYNKVIQAMRSDNPKQALTNPELVMPETIIDSVMDNLRTEHPLLSKINFQNTGSMLKFLVNTNGLLKATWGTLFGAITEEATTGFKQVDMQFLKLSAWMPISNAMLDLGPTYIDNFVRQTLTEMLANGFEYGILNNLKSDTGPIAMIADMDKGNAAMGVVTYTAKAKTKITSLDAVTLGDLLSKLTVDANKKPRVLKEVIMVVNPTDYFKKVFPATTILNQAGTYVNNVLPYPITIIQSAFITEGSAVLGLGYNYFFGAGQTQGGQLDTSDEAKFLDDARAYRIKLYGNGMPVDNTSFLYLDITGLKPAALQVKVEQTAAAA